MPYRKFMTKIELLKERVKRNRRYDTIKIELKTQLKNERDKVTEEIRKRIAVKERGEKEGKALRDKLDDQQKHFAKEETAI